MCSKWKWGITVPLEASVAQIDSKLASSRVSKSQIKEATVSVNSSGHPFEHLLNKKINRADRVVPQQIANKAVANLNANIPTHKKTVKDYLREALPVKSAARHISQHAHLPKIKSPNSEPSRIKDLNPRVSDDDAEILRSAISKAADKYGVSPKLIESIAHAESRFNPQAVSHKGAKGVMQLIDSTAKDMGVNDSFDVEQNVLGGTRYIRTMLDRYNNDIRTAIAAYNAGPGAVDKYGGIPPYPETQTYVKRVMKYFTGV